jgi:hypothetical protein
VVGRFDLDRAIANDDTATRNWPLVGARQRMSQVHVRASDPSAQTSRNRLLSGVYWDH